MYCVVLCLFNYQTAGSEIWTDRIRTQQLLFFSQFWDDGRISGVWRPSWKNKMKFQGIVLEMEMHPAVGRNPNSFALQFPSQKNRVLHSGCPRVLAWKDSDVFQAYKFAFQEFVFSFLYVFPLSVGQMMVLMKGHQYSWEWIHRCRIKIGCRFSLSLPALPD